MKKTAFLLILVFQFVTFDLHADIVICIHGFLSNTRSFKQVKNALASSGFNICLWDYPSRKKLIGEHGFELAQFLQKMVCECPGQTIHFAAHSVGALVLRAALNSPNCPDEAKRGRAVLFAPPNQGSSLGRRFQKSFPISFAMGNRCGLELLTYDSLQVNATYGNFPSSIEVLVLAGTRGNKIWFTEANDGFLTVEETWLNTPFYYLEFPVSHGNLLKIPTILSSMLTFIKSGPSPTLILIAPVEGCPNP